MLLCLIPFLAGLLGLQLIPDNVPYGRLVCLWLCYFYTASWVLMLSVSTANTAGHTKKITTNAILLIGYCIGNFIGPFFFEAEQAPSYSLGISMMFFCCAWQFVLLAILWTLFWYRNKRRNNASSHAIAAEEEAYTNGYLDKTDKENHGFQVSCPYP